MLTRFFKPRWQHPNAQVRRRALDQLGSEAETVLIQLARTDPEPEVRRAALNRLADVMLLERVIGDDTDAGVREAAVIRLKGLLAGTEPGLDAEERCAVVTRVADLRLVEHVARHGCDAELRLSAVQRVTRSVLLHELVRQDSAVTVRLAALERIEDRSELEALCKAVRGRDKPVYRAARARVDAMRREDARPQAMQQAYDALCKRLEALGKCAKLEGTGSAMMQLQQEWQSLVAQAPPQADLLERFANGITALTQQQQRREQRAAHEANGAEAQCRCVEAALAELGEAAVDPATVRGAVAQLQAAELAWSELPGPIDSELQRRFATAVGSLRRQLTERRGQLRAGQHSEAALAAARALLDAETPITAQQLKEILRKWPADGADPAARSAFDAVVAALEERLQQQRALGTEKLARLEQLGSAMEQALEAGESRPAAELSRRVQSLEQQLAVLGVSPPPALSSRLQRLGARLRELRDWEQFANTAEREKLCEQVEALPGSELHPRELARRIKRARQAWNALGSTDHKAMGPLRQRFFQGCDTAYEPCAAFYEQEKRERATHLAERAALCQGMQAFIADTDWRQVDLREVERFLRQSHQQWKAMGPVDRDAFKRVSKQYHQAGDVIGEHLRRRRDANLRAKQALIADAAVLVESLTEEQLPRAMDGIRDLQQRWKTIGPAPRREEQVLWKRLQQAGDAVFGRRGEQRQQRERELRVANGERELLCARLQDLRSAARAGASDESSQRLETELRAVEKAWDATRDETGGETGGGHRRPRSDALQSRFEQLQADVKDSIRAIERTRLADEVSRLGQAALLVAGREAGASGEQAASAEAWDALTCEPAYIDAALLRQRWQRAGAGAGAGSGEPGADPRAAALCLRMEVEAGVDSPPGANAERMALQVERLNAGIGQRGGQRGGHHSSKHSDGAQPLGDDSVARTLEREWWGLPPLSAAQSRELTERFLRARDAYFRRAGLAL